MKKLKRHLLSACSRNKADGKTVITGIAIVLLAGVLARLLSGSPLYMLRLTGIRNCVPKAWVFTLIWTVWYIALGFSFGFILGSRSPGKEICKYKGSLWFVCMMIFNIIWYPLFFKAGTVFIALMDSLLIILFCLLTALQYFKISRVIGVIFALHLAWLLWCFAINLKVFLSI